MTLKKEKFTHISDKTPNASFWCRRQHSYGGKFCRRDGYRKCAKQIFGTSARRRRILRSLLWIANDPFAAEAQ